VTTTATSSVNRQRQHPQQAATTMAVGGGDSYGSGQRQQVLFCWKLQTLFNSEHSHTQYITTTNSFSLTV